MSEVNIPLLRKMVEWVEEQENRTEGREWYQETWITPGRQLAGEYDIDNWCETACCVAGKVALIEGWTPVPYDSHVSFKPEMERDGRALTPRTIATDALGLTGGQAAALFEAENTAEDIRLVAEDIAGERL